MPSSVKGVLGSCVVIPCSYNYPDPEKELNQFTAIWTKMTDDIMYHTTNSNIKEEYRTRTELIGDVRNKNCSLKIEPLQQCDQGPFYFSIEIGGYNKYSYRDNAVSIALISK